MKQDNRQCAYYTEALSRNYCCGIGFPYSEGVFVALGIQHAMRMHLWPVRLYNIFPRYLKKGKIFEKQKGD